MMKLSIMLCAALILASCSSTERTKTIAPDAVPCTVPHEKPPKDGGLGGTGLRQDLCE